MGRLVTPAQGSADAERGSTWWGWRPRDADDFADSMLVLPIGATEQHGPHLPLSTDSILVEHVAHAAVEQVRAELPVLVAPTIPFGFSAHHLPFGPTCSISVEAYGQYLREACLSLHLTGFRRLFILNGHGGNVEVMQMVAKDLAISSGLLVGAGSYWTMATMALSAQHVALPARVPGHAGAFETSLMLALRPDLVALPLPGPVDDPEIVDPADFKIEGSTRRIGSRGFTDDPSAASASSGEAYLQVITSSVAQSLRTFWSECESAGL